MAVDVATVVSQPLFEDHMAFIVCRADPLDSARELSAKDLRLVAFPPHYALRRALHSAGIEATYVAEAETIDAMLRLVSSGVGNCILPSRIPDKLLADYDLRKLPMENHSLSRWVVAITPTERPLSSLASPFVQCALEVAGELRSESSE